MSKRPLTPVYLFFYLLFWPDTWRIAIGLAAAFLVAPRLMEPGQGFFPLAMLHIMLACIGYAGSAKPARAISDAVKKVILKDRVS